MSVADPMALYPPPAELPAVRRRALVVGILGILVAGIGAAMNLTHFLRAYLIAYLFWSGIALGCFAIAMLHQLTGGAWGLMVRRVLGAGSRTLPYLLVLFVPIALGAGLLYPWADPHHVAGDALLEHKAPYLNVTGFVIRALVYFAIWLGFAFALNRWSLLSDESRDHRPIRKLQVWSGFGLVAYVMAASFASFDWLMSLEPHWASSLFGVYFIGSQVLGALSFVIIVGMWLATRKPLAGLLVARHFHDYGKLLLAFVMLWTYFAVSQFLIIWSGNLPEETLWYAQRLNGGWGIVALGVVLFHFALPFLLLLSRDLKRNARLLASVAFLLLVARWIDLVWQAWPSARVSLAEVLRWSWIDVGAVVGLGGVWVALFLWQLGKRALLPVNDPHLREALGEA